MKNVSKVNEIITDKFNNVKLLETIKFLETTNNIKGCSFASVRNYTNNYNEKANYKLNLGYSLDSMKNKDLQDMKNANVNDVFSQFENTKNIEFSIFEKAYNELQDSLLPYGSIKSNGDVKVPNKRSKAQINAYTKINSSVKVHNTSLAVYVYGYCENKTILERGNYPTTNKQKKTICKDFIKKHFDFRSNKFRLFIVENIDVFNASKMSFRGKDISINY